MSNYKTIHESEIKEAFERNPQEGALMLIADLNLNEANDIANGIKKHKVETHKNGWYLTINTSNGVVGLWSCWLGDSLVLCFPKDLKIEDEDVSRILELNLNENMYYGCGQYYSDRIDGDKGRLWVGYKDFDCYQHSFSIITENKDLKSTYYGHNKSSVISTTNWNSASIKDERDLPINDFKVILKYRDKFIKLLMFISNKLGEIKSIGIQYQLPVYIPEELEAEGYSNIEWIKGSPNYRNGWGSELVYATKGNEKLMLKSANSLVPWVCYRQFDVKEPTVGDILNLLTV